MDDVLAKRLEKVRAYTESAKRRANLYTDVAKFDDGRDAAQSLGALHKAPAPGKKLQKLGFIMLWVPEPTGVTCAIGAPMILSGGQRTKVEVFRGALRPFTTTVNQELSDVLKSKVRSFLVLPGT